MELSTLSYTGKDQSISATDIAFFKAKKLRSEDQIEVFPYSLQGVGSGKIYSV
jgi:hypothetical protein